MYYNSSITFANLIYSSISEIDRLPQGGNKAAFGLTRFVDWSGPPYFTADGWPYRNDNGPLSLTNSCDIYLVLNSRERLWSALGLTGGYSTPPTAEQTGATKATYTVPEGIAGRSFTFDVTCYWEGTGTAVTSAGRLPSEVAVSTVAFSGPDGRGPFGDGPRMMSSSTRRFGAGVDRILAHIVSSDATGTDPLRNLIVLVSNVRDSATGELIYAGFDHTTYQPFQLYPQFVDSMRHFSHIRSLATQWQHHEPNGSRVIFDDTGLLFECIGEASMPLVTTGWDRPQPSAPGFNKGFAAINRPTNVAFGNSLRAYIEICNQLDADLWWCHPVPTVAVGTRAANGSITYARLRGSDPSDPHQVGRLLADEAYVQGFAEEITRHLKPGLRVYSEWANEVWNWSSTYWHGTAYAWSSALRAIASVEYGGDDDLWFSKRTLESPAIHAGVQLKADANVSMAAFSAAASALLAERIRDRLGPDSDREIICVAAGQSAFLARSSNGLGQLWAAMPKLFKQLDAVAHAPYRSWWSNGAEYDTQLAEGGYSAVWDEIVQVRGALLPYALSPGGALNPGSFWGTRSRSSKGDFFGYPHQRAWKNLALDRPEAIGLTGRLSYTRAFTPPGWPADRRRWNLDLICYEGGNHHIPVSAAAKLESFPATLHPHYRTFTLRYMEMIFGHGPKGLTRDPASASEESLYRPGMVPLGIIEDAEPLHDRFTFLNTTGEPSFRHGMFWSLQWWNGHVGAPQAEGAKDAVRLGIGTDGWWE